MTYALTVNIDNLSICMMCCVYSSMRYSTITMEGSMADGILTDTVRAEFNGGLQLMIRAGCDNQLCTTHIVVWFDDYPLEQPIPVLATILQRLKDEGWSVVSDEARQVDLTFFCPKHSPQFTIEPTFKGEPHS